MGLRAIAVIAAGLLVMLPGAPAVHADDATAADRAAVLQAADLSAWADVTMGDFNVEDGGDTPAVCGETTDGVYAKGSRSQRAVSQRARSGRWEWDSDAYVYASRAAASTSYARLKSAALRLCRPLLHSEEDDEGYSTSTILGDVPVYLKDKGGMPRFAVDSFVVSRSSGPELEKSDRYAYTVVYRADRTIVQLDVESWLPLTTVEMEQVRDTALLIARRAASAS